MSRCFSYPPPGYSLNEGSGQALIESIKLQSESVLSKAEAKKERKREKKHRKKEKKEKSKARLLPDKMICKSTSTGLKFTSLQKLIHTENELLERSSLTEEHAQPVGEQRPSTSSDSTQNSSKRKRDHSPPVVVKQEQNSIRSNGNVIRIRLSSQKKNASVSNQEPYSTTSVRAELPSHEQDTAVSRQEPCSTSGRTELPTSHNRPQEGPLYISSNRQENTKAISVLSPQPVVGALSLASGPTSVIRTCDATVVSQLPKDKLPSATLPPRPDGEGCSTLAGPKSISRVNDIAVNDIAVRDPKSLDKKLVKSASRFNDLFLNWVPPPLDMELESDDQDWLFSKKKNPVNPSDKKQKSSNDMSCLNSFSLCPRAQFLPEADIYALPFTVPF